MKCRVTKKAVKENYIRVIQVGYCNLQNLLSCRQPFAYSTRLEGWACDYYDIGRGICVSEGYSPISKGEQVDYEIIKKYDDKAREIKGKYHNYSDRKTRLDKLIDEFIDEINKV